MGICWCLERPENMWENSCSLGILGKIPAGGERKKKHYRRLLLDKYVGVHFLLISTLCFHACFKANLVQPNYRKEDFFSDASVEQVIWKSKPPSADYRNLCNTVPNCAIPFESKRHVCIKYLWSWCTLLP